MNDYTIESFIAYCDDMMIVEEGLFKRIKERKHKKLKDNEEFRNNNTDMSNTMIRILNEMKDEINSSLSDMLKIEALDIEEHENKLRRGKYIYYYYINILTYDRSINPDKIARRLDSLVDKYDKKYDKFLTDNKIYIDSVAKDFNYSEFTNKVQVASKTGIVPADNTVGSDFEIRITKQ